MRESRPPRVFPTHHSSTLAHSAPSTRIRSTNSNLRQRIPKHPPTLLNSAPHLHPCTLGPSSQSRPHHVRLSGSGNTPMHAQLVGPVRGPGCVPWRLKGAGGSGGKGGKGCILSHSRFGFDMRAWGTIPAVCEAGGLCSRMLRQREAGLRRGGCIRRLSDSDGSRSGSGARGVLGLRCAGRG